MAAAELHAFVVEDNLTIRENLVGTLEELTCVRVIGTSGTEDEALAWVEANRDAWDLLIVDLFLQQGSGMHLVQKLDTRRSGQKVVVFSNYVNPSVRKRCAQLGVDAVFDKSTEIDSLVDYCVRQCYLKGEGAAESSTRTERNG
ncbi:response regulator [Ramlibacter rhizophilus]|uniref:Response regulator n=1 Tax=Ramlibacter rhizophilus TaxID=1781167 RepID=A0A4Z0BPF7_9BURK|nr:response regulator [Ramlibacter rhizophilus]TFZ01183.1 response regulator [Ramlibacter rhizophilus]